MRRRGKMTVKYVSADTSALEKPERLVPDTDFMTPIREIFLGQLQFVVSFTNKVSRASLSA